MRLPLNWNRFALISRNGHENSRRQPRERWPNSLVYTTTPRSLYRHWLWAIGNARLPITAGCVANIRPQQSLAPASDRSERMAKSQQLTSCGTRWAPRKRQTVPARVFEHSIIAFRGRARCWSVECRRVLMLPLTLLPIHCMRLQLGVSFLDCRSTVQTVFSDCRGECTDSSSSAHTTTPQCCWLRGTSSRCRVQEFIESVTNLFRRGRSVERTRQRGADAAPRLFCKRMPRDMAGRPACELARGILFLLVELHRGGGMGEAVSSSRC